MRLRAFLLLFLVSVPGVARADLLAQAIDGAQRAPAASTNTLLSWAGPARQTTLPELLQLAIRQAPTLASAKLDIAIAEAQIEQTWARRDWLVGAQANGSWSDGVVSGLTKGTRKHFDISASLSKPLSTGGRIGLTASNEYSKTTTDEMLFDSKYWTDTVAVTLDQPLLRGRGSRLFNAQERRAELSRDAAVLARQQAALDTVQAIVSAYWDLVLAQRQVAITEASLDLARERLRITQIGAQGGKIANAEIPAVEQIIATREEEVLTGELSVVDRSIALRRSVNMELGAGDLALRVDAEIEATDQGYSLGPLLDRAYAASPQLAELSKQEAGATIDIEVTENGLLPQLDLALSFGPSGVDTTFGGAAKNLVELDGLSANGTLTFSQSLNHYDVRGRSKELRLSREKLRVNAIDIRAQIAQALARAVAQIELAKRRVALSQKAIDLATENIRIETDRFNLGKSTNFDVLNRVEEQRQAELRKAQALVDWHKAETVVQALTGELLPAFGITVQ